MKGDKAEPPAKISSAPMRSKVTIIGANHHFFRAIRKDQISLSISIVEAIVIRSKIRQKEKHASFTHSELR